jgi:hypothetical protein
MVLGWKFFSLAFFSDMGLGELLCVQIRSEFLCKFTISEIEIFPSGLVKEKGRRLSP